MKHYIEDMGHKKKSRKIDVVDKKPSLKEARDLYKGGQFLPCSTTLTIKMLSAQERKLVTNFVQNTNNYTYERMESPAYNLNETENE